MSPGFVKMPDELLARPDLTSSAKIVAAVTADRTRRGKSVSIRKLQSLCGLSNHSVIRARRELQAKGVLAGKEPSPPPGEEPSPPSVRAGEETSPPPGEETSPKSVKKLHHITEQSNNTENNSLSSSKPTHASGEQATLLPNDATRPKKSTRKAKAADPRVSEFIAWFCAEFERQTGRRYVVSGGRDGATVKRLLASLTIDELKRATAGMFGDSWGRSSASIGVLASQINKWLGATRRTSTFRPAAQAPDDPGYKHIGKDYSNAI